MEKFKEEKFIEKNIAELAESYDKIRGANVNIARITPDLIDGLKPVQRRELYVMFLKDGGKEFRKVGTIAGDTFGRVHPHCLHESVEFIMTDGTKRTIKDLYEDENQSFEILTYDQRSKNIKRARMDSVRITKYVKEYHHIKLTNAGEIKCTDDHPILVMRPSYTKKTKYNETIMEPTWVRADELLNGDLIYGGEISDLSFNGEDVGYPKMWIPFENHFLANNGGRSYIIHKEFTIDWRLLNPISNKKWTIHHKNFNKNDFSRRNLEVLDNSEHNLLHMETDEKHIESAMNGLKIGRKVLSEDPNVINKMKERNSFAIKQINKVLPLFKAFKILDNMKIKGISLNEDNYNKIRKETYNSSSLYSLYDKGYIPDASFDSLLKIYSNNEKNKYIKFDNFKYITSEVNKKETNDLGKLRGSLISAFRKVYSRLISNGEKLVKENFVSGIHKNNKTNIWEKCEDIGIDVHELLEELKYAFIQVEDINIIKLDKEIPMYDYTVDEYGNGAIYVGSRSKSVHSFAIVKNSPTSIEDSIVNLAQVWHNIIPLIEGRGNFGGPDGSPAGAGRYIKARLSEYCIACFFEDWKDSVVDMSLAYDEETMMPDYLPAKYPNILLNGTLGIGYGMASNVPCFNFREVVENTIALMVNPNHNVVLIPDSPTGADIIQTDFVKLNNAGKGSYTQRCTYEIDPEKNIITITSLPDTISANNIREKIADIKEKGGLNELINMNDLSGTKIKIELFIRDDVNPYKFIKKLIKEIAGLEKVYPVNITVVNEYQTIDYSIKDLLLNWIKYRREQVRVKISNKRQRLFSDQRINDIKIFILNKDNLEETIKIFRTSRNLEYIQKNLLNKYKDSEVRMDSVQAKTLSNMRFHELSIESYEKCLKRRDELIEELQEVEDSLKLKNGIDKIIIAELRDGIKRFGTDRRSNVIPYNIDITSNHDGYCVLQLSEDGNIIRRIATNVDEEPIPVDSNGFAVLIDNESAFILIDDLGYHTFIRSKEIPLDTEVPVNRYSKKPLNGKIIAMLPAGTDKCCTLVSKKGIIKRIIISDLVPSKKPCISIDSDDQLIKGIVFNKNSIKELLIYTKLGFGQRVDNNSIRITSPNAKGMPGFKLRKDDEIKGVFAINPEENEYLLYITIKGKIRLNDIKYLPIRESKHDQMVSLISLSERDKLFSVIGCNKLDKLIVFYSDGESEEIDLKKIKESTMSELPKKYVNKDMTSSKVLKVKLK